MTRATTVRFMFALLILCTALVPSHQALASQPESHWEPLTDADVARVVTTLEALVGAAESGGTAEQPTDIEMSGFAAEVLWAVESAVAEIDGTDRRDSETLLEILEANGYQTERQEVLMMWGHYAKRVLALHDAIRLGYFERDLGAEWVALEAASRGNGGEAQWRRLSEIDRAAWIVATSARDRGVVEAQSGSLERLREHVEGWPEP